MAKRKKKSFKFGGLKIKQSTILFVGAVAALFWFITRKPTTT